MAGGHEFPFPVILPHDYNTVRGTKDTDFPHTHDEWLKLINERRREHELRGFAIRPVPIDPNEFSRYCRLFGQVHDLKRMMDFTIEKVRGQTY